MSVSKRIRQYKFINSLPHINATIFGNLLLFVTFLLSGWQNGFLNTHAQICLLSALFSLLLSNFTIGNQQPQMQA